jgi:aminoglycoside/choline kinase family phosphotransferase
MTQSFQPSPAIVWPDTDRQAAFERWLAPLVGSFGLEPMSLEPASADASFRRYLRVEGKREGQPQTFIIMDAPPPAEDVRPFVRVARLLSQAGLQVPEVLAADETQGFLMLTDLGRQLYLKTLQTASSERADQLMRDALAALARLQQAPAKGLPAYD